MDIFSLENVRVRIKDKMILDLKNRSIHISKGDVIGIIGENGAGKTTFIRVLLDLIKFEGKVERNISFQSIGVQMQKNGFSGLIKVYELISFICNSSIKDKQLTEKMRDFQIDHLLNKRVESLSGGELQRLTLFLVMYHDPDVLIFDEITTGLDYQTRKSVLNYLKKIINNKTVLMVTHYYEEIEKLANKLLILHQGRLLDYGFIDSLFEKYEIFSTFTLKKDDFSLLEETTDKGYAFEDKVVVINRSKKEEDKRLQIIQKSNCTYDYKKKDFYSLYKKIIEQKGVI
ncbi:ATP-binding cassette domain-containing protein [Fervidibacillus halotolerans]|uniref:ABC transporter ATP-binding protein n=1 Tax=Fervidibacillus halotolerans TaxID=2980027 RepID=A0A9E8LZN4_9BACI|nr:ABC transporter ATP-binding protein [Fervidibacillus halotolerans]WAA12655.1 ABC transporter ATP-binding protein [Fervidibacillus halotolerans]